MAKIFCRALDCGMSFATPRYRDQHQDLMHHDWVKETAYLLVNKINNSNSPDDLERKVLRTSIRSFSYAEAKEFINNEDEIGKAILKSMVNIVETYFAHHDEYTVKELLTVSEFNIR